MGECKKKKEKQDLELYHRLMCVYRPGKHCKV